LNVSIVNLGVLGLKKANNTRTYQTFCFSDDESKNSANKNYINAYNVTNATRYNGTLFGFVDGKKLL